MAEAKTYSICFRLRRTVVEDAFVRVPVTDEAFRPYPDEDGKVRLDVEKLKNAAIMLGDDPSTRWVSEDPPTVQLHPWQITRPTVANLTEAISFGRPDLFLRASASPR